jgi:murein DD-endopeptidase MepM/ murein hydrolase activator NlpD
VEYVQLAALAWRYRYQVAMVAVALFLLVLTGLTVVSSVFGAPLVNDAQQQYYIEAVRELKEKKGLVLDFHEPLALDAVRLNQDFSSVTLDSARETVALFVKAGAGRGKYELKSLDQVLADLALTAEQRAMAVAMAQGDSAGSDCYGFVPRTDGPYLWPVAGVITSCFGPRLDPVEGVEGFHWGIDVATTVGTPVSAAHSGSVHLAGWSGNYGNLVILISDDGSLSTWYGHLSECTVKQGQHVNRGDILGLVGTTGKSTGPHLHFETRLLQTPADPLTVFK